MVWWEGDTLTTPTNTKYVTGTNSGLYIFQDWTTYLPKTTDLFYANGTISFSQVNQGGLGDCYFMAASAAIGEWPSLVKSVFLTQNKNTAGIFALKVFIRGKPYVISIDDNIMFSNGDPVFALLSDDKTSAWGLVAEKVYAKVLGNYLKADGGYLDTALRFLTGAPQFSYTLSSSSDLSVTFALINAADVANYIMAAATGPGTDTTYNVCGIANGHAYSILSAFTMTDSTGTAT